MSIQSQVSDILSMLRETSIQTETAAQKQLSLWRGEIKKPLLLLKTSSPLADALPSYDYQEIHFDREKMLVSELKGALRSRAGNACAVPSVRSNMGCGIYPTLFGLTQDVFPDKMPWLKSHLSKETIQSMTKDHLAFGREFTEALEQMQYMKDTLDGTGVQVYPLDLQGLIDIGHLVLGDDFFYELYDDPDFIDHLLDLTADAIILGVREVLRIIAPTEFISHYNDVVLPASTPLKLSEDTSTLISREHIDRYAMHHTQKILDAFGGGYVHYCGKNDHLLDAVLADPRVIGLNFGNPDKHDMESVLRRVAETGKVFYGACDQKKDESNRAYFSRLIAAQQGTDAKAHLLLPFYCPHEQRDDVISDWIASGGEV